MNALHYVSTQTRGIMMKNLLSVIKAILFTKAISTLVKSEGEQLSAQKIKNCNYPDDYYGDQYCQK
jgi:hypothetical protein